MGRNGFRRSLDLSRGAILDEEHAADRMPLLQMLFLRTRSRSKNNFHDQGQFPFCGEVWQSKSLNVNFKSYS